MNAIWKYLIDIVDEHEIIMQGGARILNARLISSHTIAVWAVVDPAAERVRRSFYVRGTGHEFEPSALMSYVTTVFDDPLGLVWHLFVEIDADRPLLIGEPAEREAVEA